MTTTRVSNPISDRQVQSIAEIIKNTVNSNESANLFSGVGTEEKKKECLEKLGKLISESVATHLAGAKGKVLARESGLGPKLRSANYHIESSYDLLEYLEKKVAVFANSLYENLTRVDADLYIWSDLTLDFADKIKTNFGYVKEDLKAAMKETEIHA